MTLKMQRWGCTQHGEADQRMGRLPFAVAASILGSNLALVTA